MGCICSKGISKDDLVGRSRREKGSIKSSKRLVAPSKREEVLLESSEAGNEGDARARLIAKPPENAVSTPLSSDDGEKKEAEEMPRKTHQRHATVDGSAHGDKGLQIFTMPNHIQGEQVSAGWPSWLTDVAAEAIKGWIPRRADSFEKLDKIGQGTYSNVYKARDLETGKIVALKKVRFVNMDPESVRFMAREIHILRRLDHPNVLKLEGLVTSRMSCNLYLVFEYMEHDLAGLATNPNVKFTEQQVKCYMQQFLCGLEHCHGRGVLHRDIKGSNLLIDNNGILRIGDFGLATTFNPERKQPMTSRVVTLWYRPPELLLGATDYGVAVDLWSTGCILAELLAGKPIMPGRTEVEQMHKIFKLCGSPSEEYWRKSKLPHATIFKPQHPYRRCVAETFKDFPAPALGLLDVLLAIEPADRKTAASALKSEYFTTKPLACDPSSLPKYPPSKEFDAKLRDEEARRQRTTALKVHGSESGRSGPGESKAMPAPDANAELQISLLKREATSNPKSTSEKCNPQAEDAASRFLIDPPSGISVGSTQNGFTHSGTFNVSSWNKKQTEEQISNNQKQAFIGRDLKTQRSYMPQATPADYSNLSGLAVARSNAKSDKHRERDFTTQQHWPEQRPNLKFNHLDVAEPTHHLLDRPASSHKKGERSSTRDSTMGYGTKKNRIHYSGPLMPPSGNIDEMLKEHERQIQQAVRKARLDKAKSRKNPDEKSQFEGNRNVDF